MICNKKGMMVKRARRSSWGRTAIEFESIRVAVVSVSSVVEFIGAERKRTINWFELWPFLPFLCVHVFKFTQITVAFQGSLDLGQVNLSAMRRLQGCLQG
jgi:hypothetical protein